MPVSLSPVDYPALIWPVLEQALWRVKEKTGEKWEPNFVAARIQAGQAGLFEFKDDGHLAWMVVERYDQGEVWMNVWILEGEGLDRMQEAIPLIDLLAKQIGASSWRFTGRKGWGGMGFKPIATVYERELT